jgi:hypothetical protein
MAVCPPLPGNSPFRHQFCEGLLGETEHFSRLRIHLHSAARALCFSAFLR